MAGLTSDLWLALLPFLSLRALNLRAMSPPVIYLPLAGRALSARWRRLPANALCFPTDSIIVSDLMIATHALSFRQV